MTRLMLRKTGPSHALRRRLSLRERLGCGLVGGGSSKKGPAARDGGGYNKEER